MADRSEITTSLGGNHVLKHLKNDESWGQKSLGAKGFTLIELLVVIVILGVLAGVVVFSVRGIQNDSKATACKAARNTIATAAEAAYAKNPTSGYPATVADLKTAGFLNGSDLGTDYDAWTISSVGVVSGTCPA